MSAAKSPVEKRLEQLRDLWLEASETPEMRLAVWRVPGNAQSMMATFFEAQNHAGEWNTPDAFLKFDADFETSFSYSRDLKDTLVAGFVENRDNLQQLGIAPDWRGPSEAQPDTAGGFLAALSSFAEHHREHWRHIVAVITPGSVRSMEAFDQWLDAALRAMTATAAHSRIRLAIVDFAEDRQWEALVDRHPKLARVIDAPIDLFDIARATAAQSGGSGPQVAYRQMLTDVLTLLEKGSAAQTAQRADKALAFVERQQWPDQQVVLHMAVAGAHIKEQQFGEAIGRYRLARECATRAEAAQHPAGATLVMQTWFGEAGTWFAAKQPERAAQAYRSGSDVAKRIPNAMFAIEGLRMAAYCLAQDGQRQAAREHGLLAVAEAKPLSVSDRTMTTLPVVLQDLLRLQDQPRAEKIERCAADYQAALVAAHKDVEAQAARLGPQPSRPDLQRIERAMETRMEAAFAKFCGERERLIAGGDEFFRKVVAVGRDFLHGAWSGVPDVKHPLDKDLPEWSEPPQFALLPDPAELTTADLTSTEQNSGSTNPGIQPLEPRMESVA